MRIGISTSVIQRGQTGIAQYLFALIRALIQKGDGHQFVLFALEDDRPLFDFARDRVELVSVPEQYRSPVRNILWHQSNLPALVAKHRLDVLHVPSYRRMLWRRPCPMVATIHDLAHFSVARKYDWRRMFYGRMVAPRLARRQDRIIAISENTARDLTAIFRLPRRVISVVHNGLEHDRFVPGDPESARKAVADGYGLRRPYFLYVARLEHPGKNHVRLIAAFDKFKSATHSDWQLVLAGRDWHGAEAIYRAIRTSIAAPDIVCLGFVADPELPDLYRAAGAFVYPSLFEGFGMPPVEAMACGCPVISSARGALAEVVGDAAAIVEPENVRSIINQLTTVSGDASIRGQLRRAGLARAREFDWARTARETLEVYERARGGDADAKPLRIS